MGCRPLTQANCSRVGSRVLFWRANPYAMAYTTVLYMAYTYCKDKGFVKGQLVYLVPESLTKMKVLGCPGRRPGRRSGRRVPTGFMKFPPDIRCATSANPYPDWDISSDLLRVAPTNSIRGPTVLRFDE